MTVWNTFCGSTASNEVVIKVRV